MLNGQGNPLQYLGHGGNGCGNMLVMVEIVVDMVVKIPNYVYKWICKNHNDMSVHMIENQRRHCFFVFSLCISVYGIKTMDRTSLRGIYRIKSQYV